MKGFIFYLFLSVIVPFALMTLYTAITCNISLPEAISWTLNETASEAADEVLAP